MCQEVEIKTKRKHDVRQCSKMAISSHIILTQEKKLKEEEKVNHNYYHTARVFFCLSNGLSSKITNYVHIHTYLHKEREVK